MQTGYFNAAWNDIRNSQGWFRKLLLMSLLMFIPVFGWMVALGYLLGWARDIAWGVHSPMPERLFGNEDGRLYSRGFFSWLIRIVMSALLWVAFTLVTACMGAVAAGVAGGGHGMLGHEISTWVGGLSLVAGLVVFAALLFLCLLAVAFTWIGWMRMSIYGRLSAGFQFGRMWAMLRRDIGGLFRILGMFLLINVAVAAVVLFLGFVALLIFGVGGLVFASGFANFGLPSTMAWALIAFSLIFAAGCYVSVCVYVFSTTMVVRAIGYWTRQFDVPRWRGQDDPMPFETAGAGPMR